MTSSWLLWLFTCPPHTSHASPWSLTNWMFLLTLMPQKKMVNYTIHKLTWSLCNTQPIPSLLPQLLSLLSSDSSCMDLPPQLPSLLSYQADLLIPPYQHSCHFCHPLMWISQLYHHSHHLHCPLRWISLLTTMATVSTADLPTPHHHSHCLYVLSGRSPNPSLPPSSTFDQPSNMSTKTSSLSKKSTVRIDEIT